MVAAVVTGVRVDVLLLLLVAVEAVKAPQDLLGVPGREVRVLLQDLAAQLPAPLSGPAGLTHAGQQEQQLYGLGVVVVGLDDRERPVARLGEQLEAPGLEVP